MGMLQEPRGDWGRRKAPPYRASLFEWVVEVLRANPLPSAPFAPLPSAPFLPQLPSTLLLVSLRVRASGRVQTRAHAV
ncbi:hypothetical protein E2C01_072838 [Portunus trituberculatus]|uniref:Uncharacterized protein n=1 Tax=Portunus trituberculatus TaxID=210409 RepID=A0A5B7ICG6_PORTR|nr:hypothetical protein [Portunus trituberculatus]